jgi:hypothetical protein
VTRATGCAEECYAVVWAQNRDASSTLSGRVCVCCARAPPPHPCPSPLPLPSVFIFCSCLMILAVLFGLNGAKRHNKFALTVSLCTLLACVFVTLTISTALIVAITPKFSADFATAYVACTGVCVWGGEKGSGVWMSFAYAVEFACPVIVGVADWDGTCVCGVSAVADAWGDLRSVVLPSPRAAWTTTQIWATFACSGCG